MVRDQDARACLLRMVGQQMTWQASEPPALARTAAVFIQTPLVKPKCLRPGWDAEVFGCTLQEYIGTAQLIWVSAVKCAGRFTWSLDTDLGAHEHSLNPILDDAWSSLLWTSAGRASVGAEAV